MCTKLISFVCLILLLGLVSPVWAVYATPAVENFSFEEPNNGKHNAWDEETNGKGSFTDVPDWESDWTAQDSGVEKLAWPGRTHGDHAGFLMNSPDGSAWNIVSYRIVAGDQFCLAVDASDNWTETPPALLKISLFYVAIGGARTTIATTTVPLGDPNYGTQAINLYDPNDLSWRTYKLGTSELNIEPPVGRLIGVELQNVSDVPDKKSWIGIDNVRFVPEPATILLLGLGGLSLIRRKR